MIEFNLIAENEVPEFSDDKLPLVVIVARTYWNESPRIRHHVTRQLMRRFNVLFVELFPCDKTINVGNKIIKHDDRLIVFNPKLSHEPDLRFYANIPFVHVRINYAYLNLIMNVINRINSRDNILISFVYDFPEIFEKNIFSFKIYVCYDEFPKMRRKSKRRNRFKSWYQSRLFQRYENKLTKMTDLCFTPHFPLREKLRKLGAQVEMLFHAHNLNFIEPCHRREASDKIHVGFAGYINWRLLDEWLIAILEQDDMILHLIGPNENYDISKLTSYPNMRYESPIPENDLIDRLKDMDVLIMPYNPKLPEVSILTTNSKIFQYIAACRPVIISDLPHYIRMPDGVIYKSNSASNFIDKIRLACEEDCERLVKLRERIASENTWNNRGDMIFRIINRKMPNII